MADVDEDAALAAGYNQPAEDHDPDDETQDFRFLSFLNTKNGQLPKRGEKDFEPHGTKHQDGILEASRQAMHDVLAYTRIHTDRNYNRGFYYGEEGLSRDEAITKDWTQDLDDDHCVVLQTTKGPMFKGMGKWPKGKARPSLWLLPEEALFLVERGNLDLWWPGRSSFRGAMPDPSEAEEEVSKAIEEYEEERDEGVPMSLQAAYSIFLGNDSERGKVSLERYTVYAHLKRMGYIVLRAPEWDPSKPGATPMYENIPWQESSIFYRLFGKFFAEKEVDHPAYGPLVKPGMYRSYNSIYKQIAIIPRHKPSPVPSNPAPAPEDPYRVVFHLWKPSRIPTFAKSNPGIPDFRVAVVDARSSSIPSLTDVASLLESTPWDPPDPALPNFKGPSKLYQRLRQGWRNVVLAVIDQGVISYLRLGEVAFGEEKLYERFDQGTSPWRGKNPGGGRGRGGARGRGRGGGRGRGRGRGGK
ncbi:tRNA-splicing endonuclease subunit sen54 N-term-domain-containing protein [Rhexocercosporidium sp. MPI-PUGE-AT-0058]|nr:tRNA-splicing endonuclease subunit sen54 N-term-domain-containing protein [Rhexocercosporidium sp. MPI-PUGE-AT-0058]